MSTVAPVDFRQVVEEFNQSGWPQRHVGGKLDPKKADFNNDRLKLELTDVEWHKVTLEAPHLTNSKTIRVDDDVGATTKVTASADVPGSSITIVSGYITGIESQVAKATITMPGDLGGHIMNLDLSKRQQRVSVPANSTNTPTKHIRGTGEVKVRSKPQVYQGAFSAKARLSGDMVIQRQGGGTEQVPVQLMASEAYKANTLSKPFSYDGTLCWQVSGSLDYLVELFQS